MQRLHILSLIGAIAAVPVAAGALLAGPEKTSCFGHGGAQYRITSGDQADFRIRVTRDASTADMRLQLVDTPDTADFVLVDEGETPECAAIGVRSIRADAPAEKADTVIALSDEPADFRIFVNSKAFSREQAAALFAVLWREPRRQMTAAR